MVLRASRRLVAGLIDNFGRRLPIPMKFQRLMRWLPILALMLFAGCVGTEELNRVMRSWEGHSVNELVASWGAPTSRTSDGSGGQIFTYDKSHRTYIPESYSPDYTGAAIATYSHPEGDPTTTPRTHTSAVTPTTYSPAYTSHVTRRRVFWIDSSGRIYRWSWEGV